jgi:hypothetical protein
MTLTALYSFTDTNNPKNKPLHFLHHSDSTRPDAADVIGDLAGVAGRIWKGESVDLTNLRLPHVDRVRGMNTRGDASTIRPVQLRFEVEVVDGVVVFVQELRHAPQGLPELQKRRERAEEALARVKEEMEKARLAPTYQVANFGTLEELRARNSR